MSRHYADRISTSADTSGSLKDALRMHAYERCRHFFSYVYTARLLTDYVNAKHGLNLKPTDVLEVVATDQLDSGVRSTAVEYYGFDAKDPNIANQSATACGRMDAAHFCNLGIVACVDAYRACYANDLDRLWSQIYMNALGECQSVGAKQDDYVTMM